MSTGSDLLNITLDAIQEIDPVADLASHLVAGGVTEETVKHAFASRPDKATDARYASYQEIYGDESWELDALEPRVIVELVHNAIQSYIDQDVWDESIERQNQGREQLTTVSSKWDDVIDYLGDA